MNSSSNNPSIHHDATREEGLPASMSFRDALASPASAYENIQHVHEDSFDIQLTKTLLDHKRGRFQQAIKRYENLLASVGLDNQIPLILQSDMLDETYASLIIFELLFMLKNDTNLSEKQLWKYIDSVKYFNPDDVICQGAIYNLLLVFFLRQSNIGAAFEMAKIALDAYQRCDSNYLQLFVHLHIAFIHIYAGRLGDATLALKDAQTRLIQCGNPACESAMIQITRLWVVAEATDTLPKPDILMPLSEKITAGEFWPETFLVLVALQFRSAIRHGNPRILEQHSGYEAILRSRGLVQLLPAMQLLRQEYLLEEKTLSTNKPFNLSDRQIVLLLPTTNTWQLNVGEGAPGSPILARVRAVDELYKAKKWYKSGRFDVTMKHFVAAIEAIEVQGWMFLLASEYDFISDMCKECRQRGRFVQKARHLQNTLLASQKPQTTSKQNDSVFGLTACEVGILNRLPESTSNKALAIDLGVSESTIKYHLKNIYRKLSVHSRHDALKAALSKGLIAPPPRSDYSHSPA